MTQRTRTPFVIAGLVAALALGIGLGAAAIAIVDDGTTTVVRQVTVGGSEPIANGELSVGQIYDRASKAVVEVAATEGSGLGGQSSAQGSGFVYDEAGHIVTNQHVVAGASSISVSLWNGAEFDAKLVGVDPSTDIAVLRIDAPKALLEPLRLANSSAVAVGDQVLAFGSPFGLEGTVTSGIVSALHREMTAPNNYTITDTIQTDAAINHGNSGGPLVDGQRTRHRSECADRERVRRIRRRRVRDPVQHRAVDRPPAHRERRGRACVPRHPHDPRGRRCRGHASPRRDARSRRPGSKRRPGRSSSTVRNSRRVATSSSSSTATP